MPWSGTSTTSPPAAQGGATDDANGAGLFQACNYTKSLPGWTARAGSDPSGRHTVRLTAPTGLTYDFTAPPPLGRGPLPEPTGPVERH